MRTPVFRHTGIVNADEETTAWAAQQETRSTFPLYECQECINWDELAEKITVKNIIMMIIFTDGSASAMNTDWLAYGGWGLYIRSGSSQNIGGALTGRPTTSYRAEVRAVLETIWRIRVPTCIVTDCKTVCQILDGIIHSIDTNGKICWPNDDGCHDYWETIVENLLQKRAPVAVRWMPSHLGEEGKKEAKQTFLAMGGKDQWIWGNCGADEMAKKGAALAAPPEHLLSREKITRVLAKTMQRMAVHIWAAEKGIISVHDADGHEAGLEDEIFGANDFGTWDFDAEDHHIDAFEDLLDATGPEAGEVTACDEEDPDPWNEAEQGPPHRGTCEVNKGYKVPREGLTYTKSSLLGDNLAAKEQGA